MQDIRVRSGVIAEPVVVVDVDVAMLDELVRHFLGHRRRCRHRYEGSAAVTGEGPDAKRGEKEESAAAREWARGEGWGETAMRAREKQ